MDTIATLCLEDFLKAIDASRYVPLNRCSRLLFMQLRERLTQTPELNPGKVFSAIRELEGGPTCGTKPAAPFRGETLKGLWHKHYEEAGISSVARNINNALKRPPAIRIPKYSESYQSKWIAAEEIANQMIQHGHYNRKAAREYTGEWLVFAKHKGENYYLCLAKHSDGDENIRELIDEHCRPKFPFL